MLPPEMLAVVVIFDVELIALMTFELKLRPAAFRLPPVTLPVAEIRPTVVMLPPVMLPVAVTNVSTVTLP
jgi:hypothetical protein